MLLTLDIGNTEITAGLFRAAELANRWRLTTHPERTPDEWAAAVGSFLTAAGTAPGRVRSTIVASVVPTTTDSLMAGVALATGAGGLSLDAGSPVPVILDVDEPLSVGADRIANVLAARELWSGDTVVVDFGTATTFDCIVGDGRFIGGVIMPGLRTSADQLTRRAAKLPATELAPPQRIIGRRTDECIRAGVLFGSAEAVDGIVRRICAEWPTGATPRVVATGGLAGMVAPLTRTIEHVAPDLTLHGLRIAAAYLGLRW